MSEPDERFPVESGDPDVGPNTAADRIRARLERQSIRAQDVEDAVNWARETPESAEPA